MPRLSDLLSSIDSVVTPTKRRLRDLLTNPADYSAQAFGSVGDRVAQFGRDAVTAQEGQDLTRMGSVMGGAPQYTTALRDVTNGLMGAAPIGATVYHGSPHTFSKFDSSKIGTGEGNQTYGRGLYLSQTPEVANTYKEALSAPELYLGDRRVRTGSGTPMDVAKAWLQDSYDKGFFHSSTASPFANATSQILKAPVPNKDAVLEALKRLESGGVTMRKGGALYTVDLPDEHIAKMLDWDKPLSRQPQAKSVIDQLVAERAGSPAYWRATLGDRPTGGKALRELNTGGGHVEERLRDAGIPGIRYLDGVSRGAGAGTSNYVVFPGNESMLTILERNGVPIR